MSAQQRPACALTSVECRRSHGDGGPAVLLERVILRHQLDPHELLVVLSHQEIRVPALCGQICTGPRAVEGRTCRSGRRSSGSRGRAPRRSTSSCRGTTPGGSGARACAWSRTPGSPGSRRCAAPERQQSALHACTSLTLAPALAKRAAQPRIRQPHLPGGGVLGLGHHLEAGAVVGRNLNRVAVEHAPPAHLVVASARQRVDLRVNRRLRAPSSAQHRRARVRPVARRGARQTRQAWRPRAARKHPPSAHPR